MTLCLNHHIVSEIAQQLRDAGERSTAKLEFKSPSMDPVKVTVSHVPDDSPGVTVEAVAGNFGDAHMAIIPGRGVGEVLSVDWGDGEAADEHEEYPVQSAQIL